MPLEIKNKRSGKVEANGVVGNSLRCGHCDTNIVEGSTWIALDDPYHCLIHEQCISLFNFNGELRSIKGKGRAEARENMDWILSVVERMVHNKYFQMKFNEERKRALQQLCLTHQALRSAGVIKEVPAPDEYAQSYATYVREEQEKRERKARKDREKGRLPANKSTSSHVRETPASSSISL